jgi:hypothetical protein
MHRPIAALAFVLLAGFISAGAQSGLTTLASTNISSSNTALDDPSASSSTPSAPQPDPVPAPAHSIATSFSLGVFPQLTATRVVNFNSGDFDTQSLSPSAGVLGTFRQQFRPWLGYSVNMGFTRGTIHFTQDAGHGSANTADNFYIANDIYELSLSWVAEKRITPKLSGFADVGAGMVSFLPAHRGANAASFYPPGHVPPVTFRPLGVGGIGIDYHFTPSLALRAEFRGQLYKNPDYGIGGLRNLTVTSEPTLSLTYTFHAKKR